MDSAIRSEELLLKIAAVCAISTTITTFFLWLLPQFYQAPQTFEEGVALASNSFYLSRLWVNLLHIPLALTGYFGLAYILRNRELPKVSLGMIWFLVWGLTEMIGVSSLIFSVNGEWRSGYLLAGEAEQLALQSRIEAALSIWDSLFFVLLIGFLLGTTLYGWATWKGKGLEKLLSYCFWLAVPLTLLIIFSKYAQVEWAGQVTSWIYPLLQPFSRFILGLFIWKQSGNK
ncbi:MAG: hypothetical protein ACR2MX_10240 [Cyclobacteriaceae bacterium]